MKMKEMLYSTISEISSHLFVLCVGVGLNKIMLDDTYRSIKSLTNGELNNIISFVEATPAFGLWLKPLRREQRRREKIKTDPKNIIKQKPLTRRAMMAHSTDRAKKILEVTNNDTKKLEDVIANQLTLLQEADETLNSIFDLLVDAKSTLEEETIDDILHIETMTLMVKKRMAKMDKWREKQNNTIVKATKKRPTSPMNPFAA